MERYQRILVCIDQPERDQHMLGYTGAISRSAGTKEIHLLHVKESAPGAAAEDAAEAAEEITSEKLRHAAEARLEGHGEEEIVGVVLTGAPLIEILRYALDHDIDLIVIGRRPGGGSETQHEATLARRITQKATCSVLVLPENARIKADRILVPVRDSECSANALEVACRIAKIKNGVVSCLNIFRVTTGYARVGTTLEEHTTLLETWAEKECRTLIDRVDTAGATLETHCLPDLYAEPVPIILEQTAREEADLIVIGARGRSGAAGVLLGAVTEQLIRQSNIPVLAVKKKGECLGVLQALLTLAG